MEYIQLSLFGFQSTRSARSATWRLVQTVPPLRISIHALREERDKREKRFCLFDDISIHALREERDGTAFPHRSHLFIISIHALREERDDRCGTMPVGGG